MKTFQYRQVAPRYRGVELTHQMAVSEQVQPGEKARVLEEAQLEPATEQERKVVVAVPVVERLREVDLCPVVVIPRPRLSQQEVAPTPPRR